MDKLRRAYVQGDWLASPQSGREVPAIRKEYDGFLSLAADADVVNTATWHLEAEGVETKKRDKSADAVRNCRQVSESEMVITFLQREHPPTCHWGSLSIIALAVGQGKPSILIAPEDCVVWQHHMVHHPLVRKYPYKSVVQVGKLLTAALRSTN